MLTLLDRFIQERKFILAILRLTILLFFLTSCFKSENDTKKKSIDLTSIKIRAQELKTDGQGKSNLEAVLKTIHGNIVFKFFPNDAPNTVTRFIELIQSGFYDGLSFHRVVPNFVIQGGDPTGTGTSGSGKKLIAEFNSRKHLLGSIAMARAKDIDSADSQFYIALKELPQLDGKYTIFAQVIKGFEVLPQIVKGDKMIFITLKGSDNLFK